MPRLADRLTLVVDACLAGIVLVAPYFMGGRHPVGQLIFVALSVVMAVAWTVRQWLKSESYWRFSGAEFLLVGAALLIVIQLVPLSPGALKVLAPATARLLPPGTVTDSAAVSNWSCISLAPTATLDALVVFVGHGLLLLVTIQRIKTIHDVERIMGLLALGAVLMAVVGLAQYSFGNGRFMWVYEHPRRTTDGVVKGSFINRNHFAHFLALGVGPLVWCIARSMRGTEASDQRSTKDGGWLRLGLLPLGIGMAIVFFAGLSTLSRGGAIAMATALCVSAWMLWRSGAISLRFVGMFAGVAAVLGCTLLFHGYDKVERRLDDLTEGSVEKLDNSGGRRRVWTANWAAYCDYRWFGTGANTHIDVYPVYMTEWMPVEYTHAESGYFQIASSMGSAGLLLLLAAFTYGGYICLRTAKASRDRRQQMCLAAVTGGLVASVVHSIVDFVWFIPACMSVTMICAACAVRIWMMSRPTGSPRIQLPRLAWGSVALATTLLGTWLLANQWRPARAAGDWDEYLRQQITLNQMTSTLLGGTSQWTPEQVAQSMSQLRTSMFNHLQAVVAANPDDALAHRALAGEYLLRFEEVQQQSDNAMPLSQICDTALSPQFPNRQEKEAWLGRVLKDNVRNLQASIWHARRAIRLAPLKGENYAFLSQLCFLEGGDANVRHEYVEQAIRVRPLNESVLIVAAEEAGLRGDSATSLNYTRQAFHMGGHYRPVLLSACAGRYPVAQLMQELQPTLDDWDSLFAAYKQLNQPEELRQLCEQFASMAQQHSAEFNGVPAARMWADIGEVDMYLGDMAAAAECARRAARCAPDDKKTRTYCSLSLCAAGFYEEAEPHIRWCLQRSPENGTLQALARKVTEVKIFGRERFAAGPTPARQ